MSCCGQRRAAAAASARAPGQSVPNSSPAASAPSLPVSKDLLLRYLGAQPLSLRGPRTGRAYYFAAPGSAMTVDANDAGALLGTGLFARLVNEAAE
jgi:hypothetical protein